MNEIELKVAHLEEREKSNTKRLDDHDTRLDNLEKTYSIMEKMDYRMGQVETAVDKIDKKLDAKANENDIEKLKELLELCAYDFYDDRFPTIERYYEMQQKDTPYKIIAKNKNNDFHIDFSCFRRELDQSITLREYIHRIENGKVAVDVLEKRTTPEGTKLRFDDITTEYMNASFKTGTVEYMYHIKSSTKRQKDINDMKKIEPYIDKEKLKRIINNPPQEVTIKNITEPESIKMNKK